jgi:protease-4
MIPEVAELMNEKLGITFDTVGTGKFTTSFTPYLDWNSQETQIIQNLIDQYYEVFLERVAVGRNMSKENVQEIAQGRVWTGKKAVELGLCDQLGGLDDATNAAAAIADLDTFRITEYPKIKDPLQQLIEDFSGKDAMHSALLRSELKDLYPAYRSLKEIQGMNKPQPRIPFYFKW